ncbi:MAG TPA: class I SAM-dependent methyltransferase [Tepidisphaeraceae bacterium]|jgi:SAM-dependent methyltransferase|nr:class I SAM-dependent methyltransferase [Tepidisphaeraceae bacterium]
MAKDDYNAISAATLLREPLALGLGQARTAEWSALIERPAQWNVASVVTATMLDRVHARLQGSIDEVGPAMQDLLSVLWSVKSASDADVWARICQQCLDHPVRQLIHQDPFAARCFNKPRGYAGDAVLIDFLYTRSCRMSEADDVSPLGERIFEYTRDISAGHAVRRRRDLMATILNDLCATTASPHVLSVACGHLREASLSSAVLAGKTGRFVALDQDELSLQLVDREVGRLGVTTVCSSIRAMFRGPLASEKFDLIYSTGLYDYLDDRIAGKLTQRMFEMLNPGGRLVVANFAPETTCAAYMDALLDWKLIYRNADQMMALAATIPQAETLARKAYIEENENIVFLDICKA